MSELSGQVARIQNEMRSVMRRAGFEGRLSQFMSLLKNDSRFYHTTDQDLLDEFRSIMSEIIAPRLPEFFDNLPTSQVEVVAFSGQGAQYIPSSTDGKRPGQFQVSECCGEFFG